MESNLIKEARAKLKTVMILNRGTAGFKNEKGKKGKETVDKKPPERLNGRRRRHRKAGVKTVLP